MDENVNRKFARLNLSCDIEFNIESVPKNRQQLIENTKTKDISVGGMCFITYTELPIGTILTLKFKLKPDTAPIALRGKIVWNEMFDIGGQQGWDNGIQFLEIPDEYKESIHQFIDTML